MAFQNGSNPQLLSGVTQSTRYNQMGGAEGFDFYYNGSKYADINQANAAAQHDQQIQDAQRREAQTKAGLIPMPGPSTTGVYQVAGGGAGPSSGGSGGDISSGASVGMPPSVGALINPNVPSQAGNEAMGLQTEREKADAAAAAAADAAKRGDMSLSAQLHAADDARRMGYMTSLMGSVNGPSGGGGADTGNINANEEAARASAFARAKEQAGQTALASVKALDDLMAGSGRMGSSQQAQGEAGLVGQGAQKLDDYTTSQLVQDLNRSAGIADRNYAGDITKRGQNLNAVQSMMSLLGNGGGLY